ncbi:MAG: hypothetical protein J6S76_01680 [Clostridia bacterium]|nr:hypothetical protein [Clostridia bacterium]
MKFRITAALLALFLIAGASQMTACTGMGQSEDDSSGSDSASLDTEDTQEDSQTSLYQAELPAGLDYGGAAFHIVTYDTSNATWYDVDFSATGETGDTLNDAAYRRMTEVERLLNIDIVANPSAEYGNALIRKSVLANDGLYDCGFVNTHAATTLAEEELLLDLYDIETLDLSAPWWDPNAVNDLTVGGRLFMVTGDISIMYKKSIGVLLFNKHLLNDQDLEDPYQLVKENKWTIDKFNEMAASVSADVNGDGAYDLADKYGLLYYCDMIALGLIGGGTHFTEKNAEDYPTLTFYNDRTVSIFEKYTQIMYDPQKSISWSRIGKSNDDIIAMFQDNRGLFNFNEFHAIENMRRMDTAFGILPMPMYDASQERYYHTINPHVAAMLLVPADCRDVKRVGYVLDALGAESKNTLTPAYYEQYLKSKGTRDNESEEMLDIIFNSMTYDIGYLYDFGGIGGMTLGMVNNYKTDLASEYASRESGAREAIDQMVEAFRENG